MKYDFKCNSCDHIWEAQMKANEFREIKEDGLDCPECDQGTAFNQFNPGAVEVCYKGFQWSDKNYREKKYRKDRSKYMDKRQRDVNYVPKLAPNYKGQRTKTWKEARDAARDDGKFVETYDHLVSKEESGEI